MPENLKPCPFCGRQPRFTERDSSYGETSPTGRIYFLSCMCGGHSAKAHQFGHSAEEVVAKWNTRVESGVIAEMRAVLEETAAYLQLVSEHSDYQMCRLCEAEQYGGLPIVHRDRCVATRINAVLAKLENPTT